MAGLWLASYVALWIVVLLQVVLILGLAREIGTLRSQASSPGALMTDAGLALGSRAPDFTARKIPGGQDVRFQATGQQSLVVFLSPTCGPCRDLLPALGEGWDDWIQRIRLYVVCEGNETAALTFLSQTSTSISVLADPLATIRDSYGNPPTPFAFLIGNDGNITLKGIVNTRQDIQRLIEGRVHLPNRIEFVPESAPSDQKRTGQVRPAQTEELAHATLD